MTLNEQNELGFIYRVFFARGGRKISELYTEAKNLGTVPEWFIDPKCRLMWMAADDLFHEDDFSKVNLLAIVRRAQKIAKDQKDIELRSQTIQSSDFEGAAHYVRPDDNLATIAKELKNALLARQFKAILDSSQLELTSGEDMAELIVKHIREVQSVVNSGGCVNRLSMTQLMHKALSDWDEAYHQRTELGNYEWTPGLALPFRKMSYALNGFEPNLNILAARPGVGKTSLALNFSRFWLDIGKHVMFVSVDMSPIGFAKRTIAERSGISLRMLQFGKANNYPELREKILGEISVLEGLEKNENFTLVSEFDIDQIASTCAILKEQGKLDVLIVDYIQLLTTRQHFGSTAETVGYISHTLHHIANTLQIPVLCLSQINRDSTKDGGSKPTMSQLKDSGAIEQDAANIFLLHREDKLYTKWRESEPPLQYAKDSKYPDSVKSLCPITLIIAKSRDGDTCELPFVVVQNKYSWHLADYEAKGDDRFSRIYDDWRHEKIEEYAAANGALIRMEDIRAMEIKNANLERERKGLPPIPYKPVDIASTAATKPSEMEQQSFEDGSVDNPLDDYREF